MVWHELGQLTRVNAAQAPADQADLAPARVASFFEPVPNGLEHAGTRAEIEALAPAAGLVTQRIEITAQGESGGIAGGKSREDEHRVAVARRCALQCRPRGQERAELQRRPEFEREQGQAGRRKVVIW